MLKIYFSPLCHASDLSLLLQFHIGLTKRLKKNKVTKSFSVIYICFIINKYYKYK